MLLFSAVAWAGAAPPWGTGESQGEDLAISLVTFGPGDEIASWFGHSALVVEDRRAGQARLYNYGMFSFDEAMLARFAMGRLEFWVGEANVTATLRAYANENRSVRIDELALTLDQRLRLAKALADNVLPQNRNYLYHHYRDNCATRPRDIIDQALGDQLRKATSRPGRMTLREHTRRHSSVQPAMSVLLDFLMNDEIDQPLLERDEAFLPAELAHQVAALRVTGPGGQPGPLVAKATQLSGSTRPPVPDLPPRYGPWLTAIGVTLGALAMAVRRRRTLLGLLDLLVGLVFGVPGLLLALMWLVTVHTVTYHNENLLQANPLTFAALPLGAALVLRRPWAATALRRLWSVLAAAGLLGLAGKLLPAFDQDNLRIIGLLLPATLGLALAHRAHATTVPKASSPLAKPTRRVPGA